MVFGSRAGLLQYRACESWDEEGTESSFERFLYPRRPWTHRGAGERWLL